MCVGCSLPPGFIDDPVCDRSPKDHHSIAEMVNVCSQGSEQEHKANVDGLHLVLVTTELSLINEASA